MKNTENTKTNLREEIANNLEILISADNRRARNTEYKAKGTTEEYELNGRTFKKIKTEYYTDEEKALFNYAKIEQPEAATAVMTKALYDTYKRFITSMNYNSKIELNPISINKFLEQLDDALLLDIQAIALTIQTILITQREEAIQQLKFEDAILKEQQLLEQVDNQ